MEDRHSIDLNFTGKGWVFAGIYDGHNGKYAAEYASTRLHQVFLGKLLAGLSPQAAFVDSYETVSEELKTQDSGTTAVNFLIKEGRIFTANAGDARAIVISHQTVQQLTTDHRLDNPAERLRIERTGAFISYPYVYHGLVGLMPTRTIGDQYFKPAGVIATPSVGEHQIHQDDIMLIAACDGLFDFMNNGEVAALTRKLPDIHTAVQALGNEVLSNRSGSDNLTIIAVSLRENKTGPVKNVI